MIKDSLKVSKKFKKEKIPITFNEDQLNLISKYQGILGNTKAEVIRNIIINWLLEREGKK